MKERPILFSGPMVLAILDGRKTQTRRVVKTQPDFVNSLGIPFWPHGKGPVDYRLCPYGKTGDLLWVKETFAQILFDPEIYDSPRASTGLDLLYRSDDDDGPWYRGVKWKPSIFMPRVFSRIALEITDVRVERVQDIAPSDIEAEGVDRNECGCDDCLMHDFTVLWNSINTKRGFPMSANPWVWVIEFRRVEAGA